MKGFASTPQWCRLTGESTVAVHSYCEIWSLNREESIRAAPVISVPIPEIRPHTSEWERSF